MTVKETYKAELGRALGVSPDRVFLFWKGRVALFALLRAMEIGRGDEVVIPAFTCVAVANAVMYVGATPRYVDIDPATLTITAPAVEAMIGPRTKLILAQNTFGLSPDIHSILAVARKHHVHVIDDCAHGLGGRYKGRPNGTIAEASFFSTQWSKPYSTGLGGIAVANDRELAAKLALIETESVVPSRREVILLWMLLQANDRLLGRWTSALGTAAYRALSMRRLVPGSSSRGELEAPLFVPSFLKAMSHVQARRGVRELRHLANNLARRARVAQKYEQLVTRLRGSRQTVPEYATHTYLRYPIFVRDREFFMAQAGKAKLEMGDWFRSPLHPVDERLENWGYQRGQAPVAEQLCRTIVNLPTHRGISDASVERICTFVTEHRGLLV